MKILKRPIKYIFMSFCMFLSINSFVLADEVSPTSPEFSKQTVDSRRSAAKQFSASAPELQPTDILCQVALVFMEDVDPEVRRFGTRAFYTAVWQNPVEQTVDGKIIRKHELSKCQAVREALFRLMSDPLDEVRQNSIGALALGFPPHPDIEEKLVNLFSVEKNAGVRYITIEAIAASKYKSEKSKNTVLKALDDDSQGVVHAAVRVIGILKIKEGVPILINRFPVGRIGIDHAIIDSLSEASSETQEFFPLLKAKEEDLKRTDNKAFQRRELREAFAKMLAKLEKTAR